ncbi:MAG: hypothetical protein Tsb0021_02720 [Chlamydiales bacterium]
MICLTGDIHHSSLRTGNQQASDITEIQTAQRYLDILREANVKVTFFISGKSFQEEWDDLKPIAESPLVSVQGHNFSCFTPIIWHRVWNKFTGNYNGPAWYEKRDVQKTIEIIQKKTGRRITCWRNHMYKHSTNTDRILTELDIEICSDFVRKQSLEPWKSNQGVWHFPINVIPDHEHLYHAERTPEWVEWWKKRYRWKDDFGSDSYYVEEWVELVVERLKENEKKEAISTLIIHPITMYLCDKFKSFERIIGFIESRRNVFLPEALQIYKGVQCLKD